MLNLNYRTLVLPAARKFIQGVHPCPHVSKSTAVAPLQVLKDYRDLREFLVPSGTYLEG